MPEQVLEREQAFLAKLNSFLATLEPQEQEWLAALVTSGGGAEEVEGYLLPTLGGTPGVPSMFPPVMVDMRKAGGDHAASGKGFLQFKFG